MLEVIRLFGVSVFITAFLIIVLWFLLKKFIHNKKNTINDLPLFLDHQEQQTTKNISYFSVYRNVKTSWPLPRLNSNYDFIYSVYKELNEDIRKKNVIPSASEWLLDNFYIIEEQVKLLRRDINKKNFSRLPMLNDGYFQGNARIFSITLELVAHKDGEINEKVLSDYLKSYQSQSVLFDREIWAIPIVIRLALLECIRCQCEKIKNTKIQWNKADETIEDWLDSRGIEENKLFKQLEQALSLKNNVNPSFVEHLLYRLRRSGLSYTPIIHYMNDLLMKQGKTSENVAQKEHYAQSICTQVMGNCITSLRYFSTMDWEDLFESVSIVDQILNSDPDGTYPKMDLASRNFYRGKVEELSSIFNISPLRLAKEAVELAKKAVLSSKRKAAKSTKDIRYWHVGYYLIGKGFEDLKKKIDNNKYTHPKQRIKNHLLSEFLYLGSIVLISLVFVGLAMQYAVLNSINYKFLYALIAGIATLIPASEIAISLVNFIVCKTIQPAIFPKLELKDGIPEKLSTIVVITTLLPGEKQVKEMLEKLESHYLSNREKNLYFALIGAFKDANQERIENQDKIIETALLGIQALNEKYSSNNRTIFYFFHRSSQFNQSNNKWFGWERKRGALMEFNDLALGGKNTSFVYLSSNDLPFSHIKYVITLDSDTTLPIGAAKKMIGTMAHPLNTPIIDKKRGIVIEGYGIMQPRLETDIESSNKSLFSLIFTGQEGIDPYANAISNVYQDLFDEGIYVGKGIYDLQVFHQLLKQAFPDNAILSHDLLEGSYARTGLLTDIELIDSFPAKYIAYSFRNHRWVRGDWQLFPYLFRKIFNRKQKKILNPLSLLSRWKIFDNLRRSLLSPSLILLLLLLIGVLPGNMYIWFGFFIFTISLPFFITSLEYYLVKRSGITRIKRHIPVIAGLKASFFQLIVNFLFLPYQATMNLHAIFITLGRMLITRKNLLEWVTSAALDKAQKKLLLSYYFKKMMFSFVVPISLMALTISLRQNAIYLSSLLFLFWTIAPLIAYWLSKETKEEYYETPEKDILMLHRIARKTWRYFEEFADNKSHFLAPDNYQSDPLRGLANRTSPTNISLGLLSTLSARDFGYITSSEMIDRIQSTITTIQSLEKWNGHLYNWYDITSLKPLQPAYISTVDSGNFLSYLICLEQGLKEILCRPWIDHLFLQGIKDTVLCGGKESQLLYKNKLSLMFLDDTKPLDLMNWSKLLEELIQEIELQVRQEIIWKSKYHYLITSCQKEILTFFPWLELLKQVPSSLQNEDTPSCVAELVQQLLSIQNKSLSLNDLPEIYKENLVCAESLMDQISQFQSESYQIALNWLDQWRKMIQNAKFVIEQWTEKIISLIEEITFIKKSMNFMPLYVRKKQLFSIGFNKEDNELNNSYYDLLASEARQTSFICIARGEIPPNHWFKLGRSLTMVDRYKGLVSWTGSMFEYLMPLLIMKSYKNTLLDETYSFVIKSQKKYGKQRKMPWGASESGYNLLDQHLEYQYKAIGVPWLGLKRGLVEDAVCAPYATFLALLVDPRAAIQNLHFLIDEGLEGLYGFYEACDYTKERLRYGTNRAIVKSYMAHHQGMSFLALNNHLHRFVMQKRFHKEPSINAARFLLQEKIPSNLLITKKTKEKISPYKEFVVKDKFLVRKFNRPDPLLPKVHILSNGSYSVLLTDKGTGYSKNKLLSISRWREDQPLDQFGMFFYLRHVESNHLWSATYAPLNQMPEKYEVNFSDDKVIYKRLDQQIQTTTEVVVASGENVEIRRLTLKNLSDQSCMIEITSYFEVVLSQQVQDLAHPAFQKLFIETQIYPELNCIIAKRRPRSELDKTYWISNRVLLEGKSIGDVQFDTDRMKIIGRGHSLKDPNALMKGIPLSNSSGSVLDPVMSIRIQIKIEPGETFRASFVTALSHKIESLYSLIEKYSNSYAVDGAFRLTLTKSQLEHRYLNLTETEVTQFQNMLSHIVFKSPTKSRFKDIIQKNKRGQSSLWRYGISGDFPVILLVLQKTDQMKVLCEALKAHEYWNSMDMKIDLVILNEEEFSYDMPLSGIVREMVLLNQSNPTFNKPGGIFILNKNTIETEDIYLLHAVARIILMGNQGSMIDQIDLLAQEDHMQLPAKTMAIQSEKPVISIPKRTDLLFYNGLGGFSATGNEYIMQLDRGQHTPAPWINVIANPGFGFIVSEAGSGFTWFENSHEYKLTPWSNDAVIDPPGEVIYLRDNDTGQHWTVTPLPIRQEEIYTISHGFGYTSFEHSSYEIEQTLIQFVPASDPVKINLLTLVNKSSQEKHLTLSYFVRPILGVNDQETSMFIQTKLSESDILMMKNPYHAVFSETITFMDSSIRERTVTGDRNEFFGFGDERCPDGLFKEELSGKLGIGFDPCGVIQVKLTLLPEECKEIVFLFGTALNMDQIHELSSKYRKADHAKQALSKVQEIWQDQLNTLQVVTPVKSIDILINGWLPYQVIACRLWARSGFYQSGGAFGFRDQLQDCISMAHICPEIARAQILHHAGRQFEEGDVQHWWHEPQGVGIRTRCSDDMLWLPYATAEYIRITGDTSILHEKISFLMDAQLKESELDRFSSPPSTEKTFSLFDHCIRAIEYSFRWGEHGLPLIGSGDWNDGMSNVGHKGKGESVWLAWFIISILKMFIPICNALGEESKSIYYSSICTALLKAIENNAWDGNWYLRAFFDDGTPLGSIQNKECKIDSIVQTWAVLCGEGNQRRAKIAMSSLEDYLISREEGIIKLIAPPFNESDLEPGYIKGYLPGVRENGGQYTHAAAWVIIAFAKLGDGDKAWELFELINPINHTENLRECAHYKLEPYVMTADVYSGYPNKGRGGWSWYTGSAGWIYRAGLEYILGFQKNGDSIIMDPCIPKEWKEYVINYQYRSSSYRILVKNPEGINKGSISISIDGSNQEGNRIPLVNDGNHHCVVVTMSAFSTHK